MTHSDVIIIGGGPVGLSAAIEIADRGRSVRVLERHQFGHGKTSSTGETRQFRVHHETEELTRLALATIPMWHELAGAGPPLLHQSGCLWFGDPRARGSTGDIDGAASVMSRLRLPFEAVDAAEIEDRFGFKDLPASWSGFVQPDGGVIDVRATLRALHHRADDHPRITLQPESPALAIDRGPGRLRVSTPGGSVTARRLVLTPGPHLNAVLGLLGCHVDVRLWRMPSAWFRIRDRGQEWPMWVGFQEATTDDPGQYYGFPETRFAHRGHVRVAGNFPARIVDEMEDGDDAPDDSSTTRIGAWVSRHMPGLDPTPRFPSTCTSGLITNSRDPFHVTHEMIVDFLPPTVEENRDIVVCATGWMFKFIPLLGRLCADLTCDGRTPHPIERLRCAEGLVTTDSQS